MPFKDDPSKTAEENAAARAAHMATAPAAQITEIDLKSLTIPEGFKFNDEQGAKFAALLADPTLTRAELAQGLIDLQSETLKGLQEAGQNLWTTTQTDWVNQIKSDKELGGDKLPENLKGISKLIDQYGGDELRAALDLTGAGNNPAVFRAFHRMAQKLNEAPPPAQARPAAPGESLASTLFPSMKAN